MAWQSDYVHKSGRGKQVIGPEQQPEDASYAYPSDSGARSGEEELRRIVQESADPEDRALAKSMFPWLKL